METHNGAGDSKEGQADRTKLIVNYVPQFANEDDLQQLFSPMGKVESVKIMRDFKTGYSFGFGFVKFTNEQDAAKAIDALNGYNYRNKRLKVSYSRPPGTDMKDSNLYITNLPKEYNEEQIDKMFGEYGEIVQRTVLKDKVTGIPRGVAFVRYSRGEEAQAAIAGLHGQMLENAMLPLSVRVAEDHGRQKAQYVDMWDPTGVNRDGSQTDSDEFINVYPEEILIAAVQERKPLWDFSLPLAERTQSRVEKLWREIVDKFSGKYTLEFLIKKWRQLKEDYFVAHRKFTAYIPRGPRDHPPRPTFPYYNEMKFLDSVDLTKVRSHYDVTTMPPPIHSSSSLRSGVMHLEMDSPPPVKKVKANETSDSIDGFLLLVGDALRGLSLKNRTKLQIKILQVLDEEQEEQADEKKK